MMEQAKIFDEKSKVEKKKKGTLSRKEQLKKTEEGRKQKDKYLEIKAFALERESENFSKLLFIHQKDNWWKMFGNSAILFHYEIAKRIGMSSRLVEDSDYEHKSKDGVVNIRDIDLVCEKLEKNKIRAVEIKPEYRIYNLGQKFSSAELEMMKKAKENEWNKVNKVILPKTIHPQFYKLLRLLLNDVAAATRRMDVYMREVVGRVIFERTAEMVRNYSAMANGRIEPEKYFTEVISACDFLTEEMTLVSELRLISEPEKIFRILRDIDNVKNDAGKCLRKVR